MRSPYPSWLADYIGIPYASGGRTRAGCDCWGLFTLVHEERLGGPLPPYEGPLWKKDATRVADLGAAAAAYSARFTPVQPGDESLGDGVLMRISGHPLHLGLVIGDGVMLHIEDKADSVLESYRGLTWRNRVIGLYRYDRAA